MSPDQRPAAAPSRTAALIGRVEGTALVVMIGAGVAAWAIGLRTRAYDYDEVMHAHAVWLASQGLRPYTDFFDCHPPYFALVTPLVRLYPDPCAALQALRAFSAVGYLVFLGGLAALGARAVATARRWAWLGLGVVAFHPAVLEYLVEFRIDGWGYALATWSLCRFLAPGRGVSRYGELGVLTGLATLLCPKLALLPPLIVLAGFLLERAAPAGTGVLRAAAAYGGGLATATGLIVLYLRASRIELGPAFDLVVRYNAISNANSAFHHGLRHRLGEHWGLSAVILAGLIGWAADLFRRQARPRAFEVGLILWLALQALLVAYPHKQYYAPWYLFAALFLAFLGPSLADVPRLLRGAIFVAAALATGVGAARQAEQWSRLDDVRGQDRLIRWMDQVARPEDRVVASPPTHPVNRHDTFFVWLNTSDPRGFDSEQILARLPSYRGRVAAARFREELEAHPPALVLTASVWGLVPCTAGQTAALNDFLLRHGYRLVRLRTIQAALRPDRYAYALEHQLLE
jgi:hypothetical protein